MSTVNTVISGSYRKHFRQMVDLKNFLERERINVLGPVSTGVINPGEEFVLLDKDPIHDPRTLQDSILAKIRTSSFLVLANVDGYIGKAATFEMGYAVSQGIQILTMEPVQDPNLAGYCRPIEQVFPTWRHKNTEPAQGKVFVARHTRSPFRGDVMNTLLLDLGSHSAKAYLHGERLTENSPTTPHSRLFRPCSPWPGWEQDPFSRLRHRTHGTTSTHRKPRSAGYSPARLSGH